MGHDGGNRIVSTKSVDQNRQRFILRIRVSDIVGTFQFDSHREVVAVPAPGVARFPGVPSAFAAWHKLHDIPGAPDKKMRRYAKSTQALKIGVSRAIERVGEQSLDRITAEIARRKAYGMNDDQRYALAGGALVAVRGCDLDGLVKNSVCIKIHWYAH